MFKKLTIMIMAAAVAFPVFAAEKAAEVTSAKGRVEIVHGDAVMGKRAGEGSELIVNDILRTKRRGYAEVGFVDGTNVKVFEKSRLTINGLDRTADGYNAEIQKGKVLFNVEKMEDVAGDFRVKTTNSIIGVKGTTFGVVSGGLVTIVEVYNGNVEVLATVSRGDFESGKVNVGAIEGTGKGGDAEENKGTLVATLSSGQGMVLSSSGEVQVYEFADGGETKSLIFKGEVATGKSEGSGEAEGGAEAGEGEGEGEGGGSAAPAGDDGTAPPSGEEEAGAESGGSIDDQLFGSIGLVEEEESGGDGGVPGIIDHDAPDTPGDQPDAPGLDQLGGLDLPGTGDTPGGNEDPTGGSNPIDELLGSGSPADDIDKIVEESNDFYSNPDTRPDTQEQVDLATGTVNINIEFK